MSQFRRTRNVVVAGLGLAALVAGCGSNSGSGGSAETGQTTATGTASGNPLDTPAAATKLCDVLRPELGQWEEQSPTPNRVAFNVTVVQWAFDAGGLGGNIKLIRDKSLVDQLTIQACPQVRSQALTALNVATLAAAVAP
jgi:hypothetical protein